MKKAEATNTFDQGLIMDFNPLVTPNNTLSNALNATLITRNGNENVLQNDMGNGRVETAYLPEGYIPLGTTQLGGIVYIVSYNPLTKLCQIGSFPSPERNITSDELGDQISDLTSEQFMSGTTIQNTVAKIQLSKQILHPGDKYIVGGDSISDNASQISGISSPLGYVKLSLATFDSNGRLVTLNTRDKYEIKYDESSTQYFIYDGKITNSIDVDSNKNVTKSNFQIFSSKISGNLYLIAELEVINSFSVTYECIAFNNEEKKYTLEFTMKTTPENTYLQYVKLSDFQNIEGLEEQTIYYERDEKKETTTLTTQVEFKPSDANETSLFKITPCMPFGEYDQLSTTMYINFSLLGSGDIGSNIWRYFKESNSIYIIWNLNVYPTDSQKVVSVDLLAYKFSELENIQTLDDPADQDNHSILAITNQTSYSGTYSNNISFSDRLEENSLYLIRIRVILQEENHQVSKYINKVLYTNGVFNDKYLQNIEQQDFDQLNPQLTYKSAFTHEESISTKTEPINQNLISPNQISTDNRVRGADIVTYNGTVTLSSQVALEEDYNSFSVDNNGLTIEITNVTLNGYRNAEIVSTSEYFQDSEYIHTNEIIIGTGTPAEDYSQMKDSFNISYTTGSQNITLNVNGVVYNKISADSINKQINITKFIAPIVYNQETAANCGLSINNNTFVYDSSFYNLAMTHGGGDNEGGGGDSLFFGRRAITSASTSSLGIGSPITYLAYDASSNGSPKTSDFRAIGEEILQTISIPYSIVPIMWTNGGNHVAKIVDVQNRFNSQYMWYSSAKRIENIPFYLNNGNNPLYVYITGSDAVGAGDGGSPNKTWNATATDLDYILIQIWMKTNQDNTLFPTNTWIPIYSSDGLIQNGPLLLGNSYLGNLIGSLLCQLYVSRSGKSISGYVINNFEYYKRLQENWEANINYSIQGLQGSQGLIDKLMFKNKSMNDIRSSFQTAVGIDKDLPCLNPNTTVTEQPYKYTYHIELGTPSILSEFSRIATNSTLDTYVYSLTDNSLSVPDFDLDQSEVYSVINGKLSNSNSLQAGMISSVESQDGNLSIQLGSLSALYGTNLLQGISRNTFGWDSRNEQLVLSSIQASKTEDYGMRFQSARGPKDSDIKIQPNIKLFYRFNILKW